jgi:hypothetical protein
MHFPLTRTLLAPLACVAALLAGCAKPLPTHPTYYGPTDPLDKVVQDVNANNEKVTTLRCAHTFEATLVDDKGKARTFSGGGYLLYMKPDKLLLTASGVIPYFEIGANEDRYWFTAFPDEVSTQWWGEKAKFSDKAARQIPIRPDLILEVLGVSEIETNLLQPPVPVMRFNNDQDAYMIVWNKPLTTRWAADREIWYDRKTKLPRLILLFDANGRVILRAYLSDPEPVPETGGQIATRYDLFFPDTKSRMSLHLTEVRPYIQQKRVRIPNPGSFAFPQEPGVREQIEIQ